MNQGPAPTGHPNAGPPPFPNGWHSMDQGCWDPNSKIPHAPDADGAIYIMNLSKDLQRVMKIKQGLMSEDPASLFTFWGHNVRRCVSYDAYGDVKKNNYDLEKAKKNRKPTDDPTNLEIYT